MKEFAMPLVSIGLPTYNRPESLKRAVTSLINQTYKNIEIIVSDNASPSIEVDTLMQEFTRLDHRVRYYKQATNIGAALNFQFVLAQAHGELFMWAADDDWRSENFVSELVQQHHNILDCSVAFCDYVAADERGNKKGTYPNFYSMMQPFTSSSKVMRLVRYYMQPDNKGKANIFYGIIKKIYLQDFDYRLFNSNSGDMHLVFHLLAKGNLAISNKLLFKSTVGNVKSYENSLKGTRVERIVHIIKDLVIESARYVMISPIAFRPIAVFLMPFKIMQMFYMQAIKPVCKKYF